MVSEARAGDESGGVLFWDVWRECVESDFGVWALAAGWREGDCWVAVAFLVGRDLDDGGGGSVAAVVAWIAGRAAATCEVGVGRFH